MTKEVDYQRKKKYVNQKCWKLTVVRKKKKCRTAQLQRSPAYQGGDNWLHIVK